jgi:hypothetical protein
MNVEIGAEAALFPGKEYISGIFFAVCDGKCCEMGWACTPTHTSQGKFFHHDEWMYARKRPLPLCVYSVGQATDSKQNFWWKYL